MRTKPSLEPVDQIISGRVLPQEVEIEKMLLSVLLQYGDKAATVLFPKLQFDDFYQRESQLIYSTAVSLFADGMTIDILTVESKIGMMPFLLDLLTVDIGYQGWNPETWEDYARIVKNASEKRKLIGLFCKALPTCFDDLESAHHIAQETILGIELIRSTRNENKTLKEALQCEIQNTQNDSEFLGLRTGFKNFDQITLGLTAPDLVIVAAGPGEGKSTWTLNIAREVSKQTPVLFFSLEMKQRQILWKLMSDYFSMPVKDIRLAKYDVASPVMDRISNLKLHIMDDAGINIDDLVSIATAEVMRKKIGLIVIDYLQLLAQGSKGKTKNDEVADISRKLKMLAMKTNVPVIALSQLSRDKTRKFYSLSDLRDSGAIEQDADGVVFIFRPVEHNMTTYELGHRTIQANESTAIVSIAKWRMGEKGDFQMNFNGRCSRFEDYNESGTSFVRPMPELENQIIGVKGDLNNIPF